MKLSEVFVCVLLHSSISGAQKISRLISTEPTEVAALGRVAELGYLYDARTHNFLDISLYTSDPHHRYSSNRIGDASASIDYVETESISEKMEKLGISASLSVSILAGMFSISGSGKYLKEDKKTSKSVKVSLVYRVRTVRDYLKIFSNTSRELIDTFLLGKIDATHVVVGIEWGADVILSLEETDVDSKSSNSKAIKGKLKGALEDVLVKVSASANVDFGSTTANQDDTCSIHIHGDIIPNIIPQTIDQAVTFIRNISELIKKENGGLGKKMRYVLMPLATVRKVFMMDSNTVLKDLDEELVDEFMRVFQEMKDSELKINDVYNDMAEWALLISDFKQFESVRAKFIAFVKKIRVKFAGLVAKFRKGDADIQELQQLIKTYDSSNWTAANVDKLLNGYTPAKHRIELMRFFEGFNASFIDRTTDFYKILVNNYEQEIGVILADLGMDISSDRVDDIVQLLKNNRGSRRYYIRDHPNIPAPFFQIYFRGKPR